MSSTKRTKVNIPSDKDLDQDSTPTNKTVLSKADMASDKELDEDKTPTNRTVKGKEIMPPDNDDFDEDKTPTNKTVQSHGVKPSNDDDFDDDFDEDKTPTNKTVKGKEIMPSKKQDFDPDNTLTNKAIQSKGKMPSDKKNANASDNKVKPSQKKANTSSGKKDQQSDKKVNISSSSSSDDDISSSDESASSSDEDNTSSDKKKKKKKNLLIFGKPDLDQSKAEEWENAKHILPTKHVRFDDKNQYRSPLQSVRTVPDPMTYQNVPSEIAKGLASQAKVAQDSLPPARIIVADGEPVTDRVPPQSVRTVPALMSCQNVPSEIAKGLASQAEVAQDSPPPTGIIVADGEPVTRPRGQQTPAATVVVPQAQPPNARILPARVPADSKPGQQSTKTLPEATAVVPKAQPENARILPARIPADNKPGQQNTKTLPAATTIVPKIQPENARILPARLPIATEAAQQTTTIPPATNALAPNALPQDARILPAQVSIPQPPLSTRTRVPPASLEIPIPYPDNFDVGKGLHNPKLVAARAVHQNAKKEGSAQNTTPHPLLRTEVPPKTPSTVAGNLHQVIHTSLNKVSTLWSDIRGSSKPANEWIERRIAPTTGIPAAPPSSFVNDVVALDPAGDLVDPVGPRRLREPKGVNAFGEPVAMTLKKRPKLVLSEEDHKMYRASRMALQNYHSARPYPKEANYWLCEMCDRFQEIHEEMVVLQALLEDEQAARIETLAIMNDERESLAEAEAKVKLLTREVEENETVRLSALYHINQMQQYICHLERKAQSIPSSSDDAFTLYHNLGKRRPTFPCMDDLKMLAALKKEEDIQTEADDYVRMFAENLNNLKQLRLAQTPEEEVPTVRREIECVRIPHAAVKVANWFIQNKDKAVEDITHEIEELLIKTCATFTISEKVWEEYGNMYNSIASIKAEPNVDSTAEVKLENTAMVQSEHAAKTAQLNATGNAKVDVAPQVEGDIPAQVKQNVPTKSNIDPKTKTKAVTVEGSFKGKGKEKAVKSSPIPFDSKTCFIDNFESNQAAANKTTKALKAIHQAASFRAMSPVDANAIGQEDYHSVVDDDDAWEDVEDDDDEELAEQEEYQSAPENEASKAEESVESEETGSDSDRALSEDHDSSLDIYESFFPGGLTWPPMSHSRLEDVKEAYREKFAKDKESAQNPPVELPKLTMGMASERNIVRPPMSTVRQHMNTVQRQTAEPPFRYIETPHQRAFRTGGTNISEAQLYKDVFGHSMPKKVWTAEEIKKMENFDYLETEKDRLFRVKREAEAKAGKDLASTIYPVRRRDELAKGIHLFTKEKKYKFLRAATDENIKNRNAVTRLKRAIRQAQVGRQSSLRLKKVPGLLTKQERAEIKHNRRYSDSYVLDHPAQEESGPNLFTRTAKLMPAGNRAPVTRPRANSTPAPTAKKTSKEAPKVELKEEAPQNKPAPSEDGRTDRGTAVDLRWWFAYGNQREI